MQMAATLSVAPRRITVRRGRRDYIFAVDLQHCERAFILRESWPDCISKAYVICGRNLLRADGFAWALVLLSTSASAARIAPTREKSPLLLAASTGVVGAQALLNEWRGGYPILWKGDLPCERRLVLKQVARRRVMGRTEILSSFQRVLQGSWRFLLSLHI